MGKPAVKRLKGSTTMETNVSTMVSKEGEGIGKSLSELEAAELKAQLEQLVYKLEKKYNKSDKEKESFKQKYEELMEIDQGRKRAKKNASS